MRVGTESPKKKKADNLSHSWNVTPLEAIQIQEELRNFLILRPPRKLIFKVAAGDVAYSRKSQRAYAALLLFSYPDLVLLETSTVQGLADFPYIPGLFSFREAPLLLQAFARLKIRPDLILVEGQGIAHPRSMGIAAHLGLLVGLPSIGCAKSRLYGEAEAPSPEEGSTAPLISGGRIVGAVVRTRSAVKPVFVSPGHKMDVTTSISLVLSLCRGYRIPEPLRQAGILVNRLRSADGS